MASGKHAGPPNCELGWKDGSCCCNCANQAPIEKHPWNQGEGKGPCSERMGWACIINCPEESKDGPHVTFFTSQHGMCEMHWPNEEREKYIKVKQASKKFGLNDDTKSSFMKIDIAKTVKKWKDAGFIPEHGPILRPGWKLTEDDTEI